jgi:hypothetical protein
MTLFPHHREVHQGIVESPLDGRLRVVELNATTLRHRLKPDEEIRAQCPEQVLERGHGLRLLVEVERPARHEAVSPYVDCGAFTRFRCDACLPREVERVVDARVCH